MSKLVYDNSSIECLSAHIITKKVERSSLIKIKDVGNCTSWKCSRNAEAIIVKELNPKVAKYNANSCLDVDDKIEAENIILYINCMKAIPPTTKKLLNHTGSHKAQSYRTDRYTAARITKQIPNIPAAIPLLQIVPPPPPEIAIIDS